MSIADQTAKMLEQRLLMGWIFIALLSFFSLLLAVFQVFNPLVISVLTLLGTTVVSCTTLSLCSQKGKGIPNVTWGLIAAAVYISAPPGEPILGGWDPGVYLQTAVQVSEEGGLLFDHPDVRTLPNSLDHLLFRDVHGIPEPFGGMRLDAQGKITPQFYHLYPALMAFIYGLTGSLRTILWLNPLLAGACTGLLIKLAREWTGSKGWGWIAGIFYLLIPTQIWQFSFSTAEMLTQFFLLSAWVLLHAWSRSPEQNTGYACLAGFSFGLAALTRYDVLMVWMILLPLLGGSLGIATYRKGVCWLFLGALPCIVLWVFHQQVAPYYRPLGTMVAPLIGISLLLTVLFSLCSFFLPWKRWWLHLRIGLLWTATVGWWVIILGLWWVRPQLVSTGEVANTLTSWGVGSFAETLTGPAKVSLWYFQSNLGVMGLFLVVLFVPCLWWNACHPARLIFAVSGAAIWLVLAWNPLNDLFMMWVSRRFVPVVIPWLVVGTTCGLAWLKTSLARLGRPKVEALPVALLLVAILPVLPTSWFQLCHQEWPGAIEWFEGVAETLPDEAVVVTDQPGFGSPLRFIWGKRAFELRRQKNVLLREFLDLHSTTPFSEDLFFLTTSPVLGTEPGWKPIAELPMRSSIQANHQYKIPTSTKSRGGDFVLYRWVGLSEG